MTTITLTGNQTYNGSSETDDLTIIGSSGNNTIIGGSGDDVIDGGAGNDKITGGPGDDTLTGGPGNDQFIFRFTVSSDEQVLRFDSPTQLSGSNTNGVWNSYLDALAAWREEMYQQHGADLDVGTQSETYTFGSKNQQTRTIEFDDTYTIGGGTTVTGEGHDTITDFSNVQQNKDKLVFQGITADDFDTLYQAGIFKVETKDANNDGNQDTVISWGNDGSITLLGVTFDDVEALKSLITFDQPI